MFKNARLPRGLRDVSAAELLARDSLIQAVTQVYRSYGFDALETPILEYAETLGGYLPDVDRPAGGVFVLRDDDDLLGLRYDLTAPLARYVAAAGDALTKPCRVYRCGPVFRNEKPGPGRFRQFVQLDADTVGSASPRADAEMLQLSAAALRAAGLRSDEFVIRFSDRRLLDAVCAAAGLDDAHADQRGIVLRALDKIDRLGTDGVLRLLGEGRRDDSGDFTPGAGLSAGQSDVIMAFARAESGDPARSLEAVRAVIGRHPAADDVERLQDAVPEARFAPGVVRGLGYYTGTVFEGEITFAVAGADGRAAVFGSVLGGGRFDDLVARFTGKALPAVGMSVGVDRLLTALLQRNAAPVADGPVLVTVPGPDDAAYAAQLTAELRAAGLRAECYVGDGGLKAQFKYADRRNCPLVLIAGSQEREAGTVQVKDLRLGRVLAEHADRASWSGERPAQTAVPAGKVTAFVAEAVQKGADVEGH